MFGRQPKLPPIATPLILNLQELSFCQVFRAARNNESKFNGGPLQDRKPTMTNKQDHQDSKKLDTTNSNKIEPKVGRKLEIQKYQEPSHQEIKGDQLAASPCTTGLTKTPVQIVLEITLSAFHSFRPSLASHLSDKE